MHQASIITSALSGRRFVCIIYRHYILGSKSLFIISIHRGVTSIWSGSSIKVSFHGMMMYRRFLFSHLSMPFMLDIALPAWWQGICCFNAPYFVTYSDGKTFRRRTVIEGVSWFHFASISLSDISVFWYISFWFRYQFHRYFLRRYIPLYNAFHEWFFIHAFFGFSAITRPPIHISPMIITHIVISSSSPILASSYRFIFYCVWRGRHFKFLAVGCIFHISDIWYTKHFGFYHSLLIFAYDDTCRFT